MAKLVLRGLFARKARAALTSISIVLGVAMIAGSYVLTDTISRSFDAIFQQGTKNIDVEVTPHKAVNSDQQEPPAFTQDYLKRVQGVNGVDSASGGIFDLVSILGKNGKPLQTTGAPNFVTSVAPKRIDPFNYVVGRPPQNDLEVALDKFTADRRHFHLGDSIGIAGHVPTRRYRLVGIAKFGEVSSFGGASIAVVSLPQAQLLTGNAGKLQSIEVVAKPGVSPQRLKQQVRAVLPAGVDVRTGKEQAAKQSADTRKNFSFLTTILLAFGFIALFVGGFIIFNTYSITVAQRTREFAMLRTLGASRRQVLLSVVSEALLTGLVASGLGLLVGVLYAKGIKALFKTVGFDLPSSGTVILTRTIVVALIVGVVVTLIAAISPAVRATRVAPLEALREGFGSQAGPGRRRTAIGSALAVAGLGVMAYGLLGVSDSSGALSLIGLGAVLVFIGTALLSPRLVRPLAAAAGAPLVRFRGLTGQLARENAMRNPGRTAVTAAALMIGLALVTFVAVFADGLKAGVNGAIDKNFRGDFVVQNKNGFAPIPAAAGQSIAQIPGVALVSPWRVTDVKVQGIAGTQRVTGLDPATGGRVMKMEWDKGSPATLAALKPGEAIVKKAFADSHHTKVGDTLSLTTPSGKGLRLRVTGIVKDKANFLGEVVVPVQTMGADYAQQQDSIAIVKLAPGTNAKTAGAQIDALLAQKYPTAESLNQSSLKKKQTDQFNQLLALIYALLSLAVVVSIFGIVNTLVLTIHERTRELGLLRAVGMSRRQVRRLVRYESVITALIGGLLGVVLGIVFAAIVSIPLTKEGFSLSIPVGSIVVFLILAALAGVMAAIPPARRASRLDVLEALAYE